MAVLGDKLGGLAQSWVTECMRRMRSVDYLLLVADELALLLAYIGMDVCLELLLLQLDAARQALELLGREAWYLGQARVGLQAHRRQRYLVAGMIEANQVRGCESRQPCSGRAASS